MKICRFEYENAVNNGVVEDDIVVVQAQGDRPEKRLRLSEIKMLPPVEPSKIVCVGRNYAAHAAELGNEVPKEPLLFLKAPSSLVVSDEAIVIPPQSNQVEHEGELAVVIERECKNLSEFDNSFDYVYGYACLNDVTARDLQRRDVQFTRAKSFDTFCPVSFFIETELDVSDLQVTTHVNGIIKQTGKTSQMVFPVEYLIKYISRQMTLKPGDIIATGTPPGVSKMEDGDVCEVEIEGIGKLTNPVRKFPGLT